MAINSAGWSVADRKSIVRIKGSMTPEFFSGRSVSKLYQLRKDGVVTPFTTRVTHHQMHRLLYARVDVWALYMQYLLDQERQDIAYFELQVPAQSTAVTAKESEVLSFSLKSLYEDFSAVVWEADTAYPEGTRVILGGQVFEALRDVPAQPFFKLLPNQEIRGYLSYVESQHPFWKQVNSGAALRQDLPSFLDTDRGRRVKEHVLCRMRKYAMQRLRGRSVTLTIPWRHGADITMKDEVRFQVPFGIGLAPVVAKVTAMKWSWQSKAEPTITLTVAVPFGDGTDEIAEAGLDDYFGDDFMADDFVEGGDGLFGVAGDVAWTEEADPIPRNLQYGQLSNPGYAVQGVHIINDGDFQLGKAINYASRILDHRNATVDFPTRLQVDMVPLVGEGNLIREFDVQATLLRGKRGVDLTYGGEP